MLFFLGKDIGTVSAAGTAVCIVQTVVMVGTLFPVELALKIDIPEYFALYNGDQEALRKGLTPSKAAYEKLAANGGRASDCVACRQCEGACPQHLPIVNWLSRVKSTYEG